MVGDVNLALHFISYGNIDSGSQGLLTAVLIGEVEKKSRDTIPCTYLV